MSRSPTTGKAGAAGRRCGKQAVRVTRESPFQRPWSAWLPRLPPAPHVRARPPLGRRARAGRCRPPTWCGRPSHLRRCPRGGSRSGGRPAPGRALLGPPPSSRSLTAPLC